MRSGLLRKVNIELSNMTPEMQKKIMKIATKILSAVVLSFIIFSAGFYYGERSIPSIEKVTGLADKETGKPKDVNFSLFWDAWSEVERLYVNKSGLDKKKMVYGAISGMVDSIGDPYTTYLTPEEAKRFMDDVSGSFEGIGAEIGIRKDVLTIISPLKGSPAEKAGLRAGDKILKIDDTITTDLTVEEAVNLIRGPKDTVVILTITRNGFQQSKEIKITRGTIKVPITSLEMKGDGIAYISLYGFTSNASLELRKSLREALNLGAKKIILDLRNNAGGYLDIAVDISSIFIPVGKTIVFEDFGNGERDEYKSYGPGTLKNFPMVVLVNEGTASASEILAGALRDIRGVKLMGQKTFGKGSVQQIADLDEGSLKVTIAKWLTPNGYSISENGLVPDYEVELADEDIENERDPQLDKAIEVIKTINN